MTVEKVIITTAAIVILEVLRRERRAMTFELLLKKCDGIDAETLAAGLEHLIGEGAVRRRDWGGVERFEVVP